MSPLAYILWLPEESSVAETQPPNKMMPEAHPHTGFRNLAKMTNMYYYSMAHPKKREDDLCSGNEWQTSEWVDIKLEVFQALIDAVIYAQI